ncbi:lipopolysaccharide biosynthesis protein [Microvirga pudoricolor]|uniref:lipopolysaccharide biosynthesis protein n=1 Tax=Microvirga pudoricolor TaxID=2778729 RepID=UPI001952229D|nr:oligosaccharide flippase family protein [Microvirga pudoricolor]MBM6593022.1 oligosaccharide flippase family protein [Microvirga pudoricolor]
MNVGQFLLSGASQRTINVVNNIYRSILYKGASIVATLLLVPLSLRYLDKEQYGIWVTLTSLTGWLTFFDIGIGNGLRNRLAEALTRNQLVEARELVSTAYAFVGALMALLWVVFLMASSFINWPKIFGVNDVGERELRLACMVVVSLFFAQIILSLINSVLNAHQKNSRTGLIVLIINLSSLCGVYILVLTAQTSFLLFCVVQSAVTALTYLTINLYYYYNDFPDIAPSIPYVNLSKLKSIMSLGAQFFIMQMATVILYQTNNILIARWFGPSAVTDYNISYRYFNVISMAFSIIAAPLWSSFTEAHTQKDYIWIQTTVRRMIVLWIMMQACILIMVMNANWIYRAWTGDVTDISFSLSVANAIYVSLYAWNTVFITLLNGVGRIRLQFLLTLVVLAVFFPLTYGLAIVAGKGVVGIVWANCLCMAVFSIQAPLQCMRLIKTGISKS